jgi:DNA replication protein DnaC
LLIVDDLGLRPLQQDEPVDLYEIIRQRLDRDVDEWPPLFGAAAMDRLRHHAHLLTLQGHSFPNPPGGSHLESKSA